MHSKLELRNSYPCKKWFIKLMYIPLQIIPKGALALPIPLEKGNKSGHVFIFLKRNVLNS